MPPQRHILNTNGSFESTVVKEILGKPELRYNQTSPFLVAIEYFKAEYFARKYNSPLTNLRDLVLVQVHMFGPPRIGVPLIFFMSSLGEGLGDMSTPTSSMVASGVSP